MILCFGCKQLYLGEQCPSCFPKPPLARRMAQWTESKRAVTWGRVAGALLWLLCVWVALHIPALCNEVRYERGSYLVEAARRHARGAQETVSAYSVVVSTAAAPDSSRMTGEAVGNGGRPGVEVFR